MKKAHIAMALAVSAASTALGGIVNPTTTSPIYAGTYSTQFNGGYNGVSSDLTLPGGSTAVYDDLSSGTNAATPNAGFALAATLDPIYGDQVTLSATGTLTEARFTVFNATSTNNPTGVVQSATVTFAFYNTTDTGLTTPLAGFSTNINYGASPLSPGGYYNVWDVTNITGVTLTQKNYLLTETFSNITGGADTVGFVSYSTVDVGTSPSTFYLQATGDAAGYYTLNGISKTNVGFSLGTSVVPESSAMLALAPAGLILARRRRA